MVKGDIVKVRMKKFLISVLFFTSFGVAMGQAAYPNRIFIQRQSLLGNIFQTLWPFSKAPVFAPAPASYGTNPSARGGYTGPVAQPGIAGPVANGISPVRGPVSRGGSCASCQSGYTLDSNNNCVASGGGSQCKYGPRCITSATCPSDTPICQGVNQGVSIMQCVSDVECIGCVDCKCLSSSSYIATPIGDVAVTSLKVGDIVWTADLAGNRIVRTLIKVSRVSAPNHRVVYLVLADGRSLDVSALHPAVGGMTVGDLKAGDAYDGSVVKSAVVRPYEGTATHDILPAGETGYYFANGILMGSTLK